MSLLAAKLDSVTWMRDSKRGKDPDPAQAATMAELGGVDSVTISLHSSRRFVRDRDVYVLKEVVKTRLNLELAPADDLLALALEVRPGLVTLVSENQIDPAVNQTLEYGSALSSLQDVTERLRGANILSAHYIPAVSEAVKDAARCKADYVEFSTANYVAASSIQEAESELDAIERASQLAHKLGLGVYCGGGLSYTSVGQCAELALVQQVTVGRALIRRALLVGLERAVSQLRAKISATG